MPTPFVSELLKSLKEFHESKCTIMFNLPVLNNWKKTTTNTSNQTKLKCRQD